MIATEHEEQVTVIDWCEAMSRMHPNLNLIYAIPNAGKRSLAIGAKMKREGLKSGVPDLFLPVARKGYHGLYIEMKRRKGGSVSKEQKDWIRDLTEEGYQVLVCKGADEAIKAICDYLNLKTS